MDKRVLVVDCQQYCAHCAMVECTEALCDACLDELLQWMAVEFEAEEYAAEAYDEQVRCDGGLY